MYNKNIRKENCYFIRETTIASLLFHREKREEETKQILSKCRSVKKHELLQKLIHTAYVYFFAPLWFVLTRGKKGRKKAEREKALGLAFLETIFKYFRILFRGSIWKSA